jgi:hypothetical protein
MIVNAKSNFKTLPVFFEHRDPGLGMDVDRKRDELIPDPQTLAKAA